VPEPQFDIVDDIVPEVVTSSSQATNWLESAETVLGSSSDESGNDEATVEDITYFPPGLRLAYVLSVTDPADVCSAVLFAKHHRASSRLPVLQTNIIFLYPSDWEMSMKPAHIQTLRLLLHSEHEYSVLLHPVPISKVWTGVDTESQLLSELARGAWPYDRLMYLRVPGLLTNTARLDDALLTSYTIPSTLKSDWTKLKAPGRRSTSEALHPDILLWAQGRGLMSPEADMKHSLAVKASDISADDGGDGASVDQAAYVIFDWDEFDLGRSGEVDRNRGIYAKFQHDTRAMCEGTDLLG